MADYNKMKTLMNKQGKVFIVRHGSTDLNKESGTSDDRIRGWIDVPLNDKGRQDAEKAANKLDKENPKKIFSSDLIRAEETARIINKNFHVPIVISKDLRPWNLGDYQGKKTNDVIHELNDMIKFETKVPKGGESFEDFRVRYLTALKSIVDLAKESRQTFFVISHFRNLKTATAWIAAGQPADLSIDVEEMMSDNFKPGDVFEVPMGDSEHKLDKVSSAS